MKLILSWLIYSVAIILTGLVLSKGVEVASVWTAIWLALFLGVVNITLKPILIVLTLPINILTLGLFTFIINAGLIVLAESVIKGFDVASFWWALLFSVILAIINFVLGKLFGKS